MRDLAFGVVGMGVGGLVGVTATVALEALVVVVAVGLWFAQPPEAPAPVVALAPPPAQVEVVAPAAAPAAQVVVTPPVVTPAFVPPPLVVSTVAPTVVEVPSVSVTAGPTGASITADGATVTVSAGPTGASVTGPEGTVEVKADGPDVGKAVLNTTLTLMGLKPPKLPVGRR